MIIHNATGTQVFTEADLASLLEHLDPGSERWMDSESIPLREGDEGYDIDTSLLVEMMNEVARIVRMEKK